MVTFDVDRLGLGPVSLGALQTVRVDAGRVNGPSVSVSIARESLEPRGFAVYVNAGVGDFKGQPGPTFTRARGLTVKAAVRVARLEVALLRSAYAAGVADATGETSAPGEGWDAAAWDFKLEVRANGGGGNHADARAMAVTFNGLDEVRP